MDRKLKAPLSDAPQPSQDQPRTSPEEKVATTAEMNHTLSGIAPIHPKMKETEAEEEEEAAEEEGKKKEEEETISDPAKTTGTETTLKATGRDHLQDHPTREKEADPLPTRELSPPQATPHTEMII